MNRYGRVTAECVCAPGSTQHDFRTHAPTVLDGTKTRTTRPKTPDRRDAGERLPCCCRVGHTYAVQPGRTKTAVARIRVLSVHEWPTAEAAASAPSHEVDEGYETGKQFLAQWHALYGGTRDDCPLWVIGFELLTDCEMEDFGHRVRPRSHGAARPTSAGMSRVL